MIRVYFVFEDPLQDTGVNLSFVDVPTDDSALALREVERAAESGKLWLNLYPEDTDYPYNLLRDNMMCLDISTLPHEQSTKTVLT